MPDEPAVQSAEALEALGEALGRQLDGAALIGLSGELGAGKTTLVRGLARGLDVLEAVTSPTFVLEKRYGGRLPLLHLDLYRTAHGDPVLDACLDEAPPGAVIVVEWPGLAGRSVAWDLWIELAIMPAGRTVSLRALTARGTGLLAAWTRL